jgi:hypothetical protein
VSNGRGNGKRGGSGRDPGGFIAMPWSVLDCPAYAGLSHPARSLLWEIARQLGPANNGRLLASAAYLAPRGWKSADVINRAKKELLEAGFLHQTVQGHRPNKASWYAVTWLVLERLPGYDMGAAESFERGLYRKNAPLTPSHGAEARSIAPSHGVGRPATAPSHGAMRAVSARFPTPSHGHLSEEPSPALAAG